MFVYEQVVCDCGYVMKRIPIPDSLTLFYLICPNFGCVNQGKKFEPRKLELKEITGV